MLLKVENLQKKFGENLVLKDISFQLDQGEVLGLVGENGAGKSTLMNILAGVIAPSYGTIYYEGKEFQPKHPKYAYEQGIVFVHQELNLFSNLTIAENLFLIDLPTVKIGSFRMLNKQLLRKKAISLLQRVGLEMSPDTLIEKLTPAQKQLVEIAKSLGTSPKLIIFDEPTTSLSAHESEKLFDLIRELKSDGISVIFISHNLEDVINISDFITVLRDGSLINTYPNGDKPVEKEKLITDMIGRNMSQLFPEKESIVHEKPQTVLKIDGLTGNRFTGISFEIKESEILGIYGLVGAGRSELLNAIYGIDPISSGEITWGNQPVKTPSPSKWIEYGVGYVTEDRSEGLLLEDSITNNVAVPSFPAYSKNNFRIVEWKSLKPSILSSVETTQLKYNSLEKDPVSNLSGGNQQKVVLSKWMLMDPKLLLIDEPTRGIDVGAKYEIYVLIRKLVSQQKSVLIVSSEIEELIGLCDTILVMSQGKLVNKFDRNKFNRSEILKSALHSDVAKA